MFICLVAELFFERFLLLSIDYSNVNTFAVETDLLLIITISVDELSGGIYMIDFKPPCSPKIAYMHSSRVNRAEITFN